MGIRDRAARRLMVTGLAGALLVGGGVLAPSPAGAKGPKPAVLTMTAETVSTTVEGNGCGLRLTADYTGGKGKYTLVYTLGHHHENGTYGEADPQSRTIRRSASPITIIQGDMQPQQGGYTRLAYRGELLDNKGTMVTEFGPAEFDLVDCPRPTF